MAQINHPPKIRSENDPTYRRILRTAILMGIFLLPPAAVLGGSPAGENSIASPLAVDQVVERLTRMNLERSEALRSYSSVRVYHLELKGIVHQSADMVAKMTYHWPDQKEFTIISESGSELMRNRVLRAILTAEKEAMQ